MTKTSPTRPVARRGEVWWVAFDPTLGGEIYKTRPAVIVSNDMQTNIRTASKSCR
jgi:mRNA-degrading endonuclease toxin of MazEF toxin-antitoxin module